MELILEHILDGLNALLWKMFHIYLIFIFNVQCLLLMPFCDIPL